MASIKQWPKQERPREKLVKYGVAMLSDAELLALILRTGTKGQDAVSFARDMLLHFGGLRDLLEADYKNISSYHGMGLARFSLMQAVLELGRRCLQEDMQRSAVVDSVDTIKKYLVAKMRHLTQEVFACIYLDSAKKIIQYKELFYGSLTSSAVYPREVVKLALNMGAAYVVLVHNHPSGSAQASSSDRDLTTTLQDILHKVDVRVLDHMIVADNKIFSFCEAGIL